MVAQLRQEIDNAEPMQGLTMTALLDLPEDLRTFLAWMARRRNVSLGEVSDYLNQTQDICGQLLLALQEKGLIRGIDRAGEPCYQVWLVVERRRSNLPDIWGALEE